MKKATATAAAALCLIALGCEKKTKTETVVEPALAVEATLAASATLTDTIRGTSPIEGFNDVMISSRSAGTITGVSAKIGQRIGNGSTLISVDDRVQRASVVQAEVAVSQALLAYNVAKELFDKGNGSKAELIGAETGLTAAKAGLSMAKLNLENCRTTSPVAGIITSVDNSVKVGATAGPGQPIARVVDISKLKLNLFVSETEVSRIKAGQKASIFVAATGSELTGTVTAVAAGSTQGTGSFAVELIANNPGETVKAGMGATAAIVTGTSSSGIVVPSKAIAEKEGKAGLWIASGSQARFVPVGSHSAGAGKVMIDSGIKEGDTVIVSGISRLTNEAKIAVTLSK